jgi:hypothetical protein
MENTIASPKVETAWIFWGLLGLWNPEIVRRDKK